jgi:hypothetical protein
MSEPSPFCDGAICVNCCLCRKCGRTVGTRHLDVCACRPDAEHTYCPDCYAKRIASLLAPYDSGRAGQR